MVPFGSIRFSAAFRWLLMLAVLTAPQVVRATTWQATVGAQSDDKGKQALAFFPNEFWIHVGDSITWKFVADEIHTTTFLKTAPPPQVRPPFAVGCTPPTVATPNPSPFDGSACVNSGTLVSGQTYTVSFPSPGNFRLVCLVHANMTAVVHVLALTEQLPHDQEFYDDEAARERKNLFSELRHKHDDSDSDSESEYLHWSNVTAGVGEIVATPGGSQTASLMRFDEPTTVIHAGETVEWSNSDAVTPHTITFGIEPANLIPPSANVTLDADGARHAVINSTADSVHSGFIVAAPQERIGLVQAPLPPTPLGTVTRFRVKFTKPGVYFYICALHDGLGMKGKVIVLP